MGIHRSLLRSLLPLLTVLSLAVPTVSLAQDAAGTPASGTPEAGAQVQLLLRPDGGSDAERLLTEAEPGSSKTLAIYIGNLGTEPLRVVSYTADVSTRINGGLAIAERGAEQSEPTTWIDFPDEEFTIDPGKELRREFPLTVPDGTAPGEYVVPLAVETLDAFAVPGAGQLLQKVRKIITLYVTVPGDLQAAFELGDPVAQYADRRLVVDVPMTNTGDTTLRLQGQFVIADSAGTTIVDEQMAMGAFYRGDETSARVTIGRGGLPPGEYTVSLSLADTVSGATQAIDAVPVTIPEPPSDQPIPLAFENIVILPNADPIQFAGVGLDIVNNAESLRGARVVMVVEKDGQHVEDFTVADNLTVEQGTTTITQRYIPITGWESGTYTFSLRLETVDSGSGTATVQLTGEDVATIEVP